MSCINYNHEESPPVGEEVASCRYVDASKCHSNAVATALMDPHRNKMRKTKRLNVKRTYGLRPRTQLRRPSYECELDDKDGATAGGQTKRESHGGGGGGGGSGGTGKLRGSIVAKCRRLNANARERQRMKEINDAFVTLQGILPALESRRQTPSASSSSSASRASMTKIRTLRHAASYIQALSDLLTGNEKKDPGSQGSDHPPVSSQAPPASHCNNNNNNTTCTMSEMVELIKKHPGGGADEATLSSWATDVEATDDELFSLLEEEVLKMPLKTSSEDDPAAPSESSATLGGLNWSDDLPPLG